MGLMIVICTLTRLSHLKRKKKNRNEVFFFLEKIIVVCFELIYLVRLFYTIRVQYKVQSASRTPCTCCCKLLPNASNAESREGGGGGEFEITLKETKMKKRDHGRPGLSCSKAD